MDLLHQIGVHLPDNNLHPPGSQDPMRPWTDDAENGLRSIRTRKLERGRPITKSSPNLTLAERMTMPSRLLSTRLSQPSICMIKEWEQLSAEDSKKEEEASPDLAASAELDQTPPRPSLLLRIGKRGRSTSPTSHGLPRTNFLGSFYGLNSKKPLDYSENGRRTRRKLKHASSIPLAAPSSQMQNGSTLSSARQSISTSFSPGYIPQTTTADKLNTWETLSSSLEPKPWPSTYPRMETGLSRLTWPKKRTCLHSPTERTSSKNISVTFSNNSQRKPLPNMLESLPLTKPSESESQSDATSCFAIPQNSLISRLSTSIITEPAHRLLQQEVAQNLLVQEPSVPKFVETGTKDAATRQTHATISTNAKPAEEHIPKTSARERALREVLDSRAKRLRWVQDLMWDDLDLGISRAALWTESAAPIPETPSKEYDNTEAIQKLYRPFLTIQTFSR